MGIELPELLEMMMMASFGASWPINALKSYRSRTTKGKSLAFLVLIFTGYICGIAGKLISGRFVWYVMAIYLFNITFVGLDLLLYVRNRRLDRLRGETS